MQEAQPARNDDKRGVAATVFKQMAPLTFSTHVSGRMEGDQK
jgi:hypothetical protein